MAREFPQILGPFVGLRKKASVRNSPSFCSQMVNIVPEEGECVAPIYPTVPFSFDYPNSVWPSPQLVRGGGSSLLVFSESELYELVGDTPSSRPVYDSLSLEVSSLEGGHSWHVVTFGEGLWLATSGKQVLYNLVGNPEKKALVAFFEMNSIAQLKDVVVIGGIKDLPSLNWDEYFQAWLYRWNKGHDEIALDKNWVIYFKTNDIIDPHRLIPLMLGLEGEEAEFERKPTILSCIEQGTIGFCQLPGQPAEGEIMQLLPIGARLIAYTKNGVYKLDWNEKKELEADQILSAGVGGRSCATGSLDHHYFVTTKGEVWKHSMNGELSNHERSEYFGRLQQEKLVGSFDSEGMQYYFADGSACFVVGRYGFYELSQLPTSLIHWSGRLSGFLHQGISPLRPDEFLIETCPLNFGTTGVKQSHFIEASFSEIKSLAMRAIPKYTTHSEFINSLPWIKGSPKGDFFIGATFEEIIFGIKGKLLNASSTLEKLNVRFQFADGRTIRGPRGIQAERGADVQTGG